MDFNEAVDDLLGKKARLVSRLAQRFHTSETRFYRSRMDNSKKSYLPPPSNWRNVVLEVALEHLREYQEFVSELQKEVNKQG